MRERRLKQLVEVQVRNAMSGLLRTVLIDTVPLSGYSFALTIFIAQAPSLFVTVVNLRSMVSALV